MQKIVSVILISLLPALLFSQGIDDEIKRKLSIGFDVITDFWMDMPSNMDERAIHPGVNAYGMYNYMIGKGNFSFSPGLGIGVHNLYSDASPVLINDSTAFVKIPDSVSYKRSKLTASYLDIPIELRFKSENQFRFAIGFKFGFLMKMQSKYKGSDYFNNDDHEIIFKQGHVKNADSNRYGFVGRIGYKWFNVSAFYSLSTLFRSGKGPEMYPVSVGITIIPF
ncbi:MAG: outer membrane beta-barrel protein [Bacteroidales bacterium]|nr:outer membrane beta-barrel protein [Bacteroidales bacterium]